MYIFSLLVYCACALVEQTHSRIVEEVYNRYRQNLLKNDYDWAIGGRLRLTSEETTANNILLHWKRKEINESLQSDPDFYSFSKPFIKYRKDLDKSYVYQIIKSMPKGAALHIHSSLMLGPEFMLNMTYNDHLYACVEGDDLQLQYSDAIPQRPCTANWTLLNDLRKMSDDINDFDEDLKERFVLYNDGDDEIPGINEVWKKFNDVCRYRASIISYRPIREIFFYETLKELYNDNVMYAELRSGLSKLYELNGTKHDQLYLARLYYDINKKFMQDHPGFLGVKLIVTHIRNANIDAIKKQLEITQLLQEEMPDFIAGFDLVGQEDLGRPLKDFVHVLTSTRDNINFFFHGGETNWFGTSTDENLIDAILLRTKRIGHGYSLIKHPALLRAVKGNGIAIEVNVISNVMLSLVHDVRNHPLAAYLAMNMPVVLSSDDPGAWGAAPLTDDFYVTFMGVANVNADLRMLKQLAINSLMQSSKNIPDRADSLKIFHENWMRFVNNLIAANAKGSTSIADLKCAP